MNKKFFSMILALFMVVSLLPTVGSKAEASTDVSIWDGTVADQVTPIDDVYSIHNGAELAWIAQQVNNGANDFSGETINLEADIVLNNTTGWESWTSEDPETTTLNKWTTIGCPYYAFSGIFNGNGHTISGIYISKEGTNASDSNQGLFGSLNGSTIKNISIINSFIKGSSEVGAIALN